MRLSSRLRAFSSSVLPALALVAFLVPRAARSGEVVERILVHVNSRIVTQSQLDARVDGMRQDLPNAAATPRTELMRRALEELVNESLLEDRARELDLVASDAEVEEQISRLKEQNKVSSDEEFKKALQASGLTPDRLRDQLKRSLTVQRIVGREVNSKVDLSDDALRLVYEREKETWKIPERLRLSEILITNGIDPTAAAHKAAEAIGELRAGKPWADTAGRYSDGPTRSRGGDLGMVSPGELATEIEKVVFGLPVGGVSDPILTKGAWHIVKVVEKAPATYKPFSDVKAEILKHEQETQFQKKLAEYLDKLRRDAVIRVSAEASSFYEVPGAPAPSTSPTATPAPKGSGVKR